MPDAKNPRLAESAAAINEANNAIARQNCAIMHNRTEFPQEIAKLCNGAQNRTEFPQEMGILRHNAQNRTEFPQEMAKLRIRAQRAEIDS